MTKDILLIEDNLAHANLIKETLSEVKGEQYSVEHVQYLAQGLDLLRGRSFDVILLDLGLPDSQGLETAAALRNQEKHTPAIVLTALDDEELALKTLEMDMQDYLVKSEITSNNLKRSICYAIQRKRISEELRESEQRFASFMLNLPAAAWMKDMDGRYVYANAEAERVFSMPLAALLGKRDSDILPPETARQFGENDCRVLSEGGSLQTTEVLRQADGIDHHSIVNKFAVNGPDGKPAYVAGVALDITERKMAEEALRESQRALSTLMSNLPGMAYRCRNDKDWTMEFVSEGCAELTGYQQAGLVQNRKISYAQLIYPDDRECVWNGVQAALREERPFELVYRISTAAGVEKWVWERGQGIFGPDGELLALEGFITDITERKRAEEALRESEESFRAIFEQAAVGIGEVSPDGSWFRVNRKLCEILGYTEDELKALSHRDITHPSDLETTIKHSQLLLEGKLANYILEKRYVCKDGSTIWVNLTVSSVCDAGGNVKYSVGIVEDISERKRAEEKIERLNTDLTARAAELEVVNTKLEDLNRELETFNYTVAHDLRKPLTVINGYCQALKELCGNQLDMHCKEYLQEAYDGTWRMNRLIDALLNFSRLAHVELRRETIDLSRMAQTVAGELRLAEPGRRVTFLIADWVSADGDAALLRVVLDNLLGNAWKYTGTRSEGIIEFGTTEVDGKPAFFVRDNGAGFAMADADKLFLPFQRLPGAEEFRGHGIGLATVERIISRHGGRIWAEGEPGKGATFYFTLSGGRTV